MRILADSYELGELFTLQLHPERIVLCRDALAAVLAQARALEPAVWLARLDEIATWWRARSATVTQVTEADDGTWLVTVEGPPGTTIMVRGVEPVEGAQPWDGRYLYISSSTCTVRAARRPVVGLSSGCPPSLGAFLSQQGYVCETMQEAGACALYLNQPDFAPEDERRLLTSLEESTVPLLRLGRWPNGARSALAITGDIDALTIWDYALRAIGR
jgi:hypothetical protein